MFHCRLSDRPGLPFPALLVAVQSDNLVGVKHKWRYDSLTTCSILHVSYWDCDCTTNFHNDSGQIDGANCLGQNNSSIKSASASQHRHRSTKLYGRHVLWRPGGFGWIVRSFGGTDQLLIPWCHHDLIDKTLTQTHTDSYHISYDYSIIVIIISL